MPEKEPGSWAEALNSYRATYGSKSLSTASQAEPVQRFVRTVPGVAPLAELRHPLHAVGSQQHVINAADGSLQRSQWHGWGDVSLLKQDCPPGTGTNGITEPAATGRRALPPPVGRDGRTGLFGLLQGTEAGGVDAWLGNLQVDPSKGKRSTSAPSDSKRLVSMTQLLAQATPGDPAEDAWLGNIGMDPAKGKGHAVNPSSLRGRADLFGIMQQHALVPKQQQQRLPPGAVSASSNAILDDAWLGNRALSPNKGKKTVAPSATLQDHLFAATFKGGPPEDGCWCDLPRVGKRPLAPPCNAAGFVNAAQTIRMEEPLPPSAVLGLGKPQGKGMVQDPHNLSSQPHHVDMYSVMTFKALDEFEQQRYQHAWNDAQVQPKRKVVPGVGPPPAQQPAGFQPSRQMRYVPFGGLAQEKGMTLNTIVLNRNSLSGSGATGGGGTSSVNSSSGSSQNRAGTTVATGSRPGRKAGSRAGAGAINGGTTT